MFTLLEALNFRCLKYVRQRIGAFHVLVGPNASGKTTFLDAIRFIGDVVAEGPDEAVRLRTNNFADLVWARGEGRIELAVEVKIPQERRDLLGDTETDHFRYELALGVDKESSEIHILAERGQLKTAGAEKPYRRNLFPQAVTAPATIVGGKSAAGVRTVFTKKQDGNDNFYSEVESKPGKGWMPSFKLGPRKSTLGNLPADESRFPVATWFREYLGQGVQRLVLNSLLIRRASPPGRGHGFEMDGANLPWVIERLQQSNQKRYAAWISHLQTALPDIVGIRIVERQDDKHKYMMVKYRHGFEIPSWMVSDGTLRMLALTIPAYLDDFSGVYLIEEPENGIHPVALEPVFQSLTSTYDAQFLIATHSPVILGIAEPRQVLCFAKTPAGATDIVSGSDHPRLKEWKHEVNLGTLFAAGVLGQ